jgi:3-hydroxyisobutyrate dehydrogenase-like beta-hydroxyacid dehydrogenase
MDRIGVVLGELVDGAISGAPPTVRPGARIFLSGPRAQEVADLRWRHVQPILVGDRIGQASAVKMSTASVYKGLVAILTQAARAGAHYGVLDHVLADLARAGYEPGRDIAVATTKAWRYVPEMREIAASQRNAGLPGELFEAIATVYAGLSQTELAQEEPESVDTSESVATIIQRLRPPA